MTLCLCCYRDIMAKVQETEEVLIFKKCMNCIEKFIYML